MGLHHQNDPDLIRGLLMDPGIWVVVGLSNNRERTAHRISRWMHVELGIPIIPVHRHNEPPTRRAISHRTGIDASAHRAEKSRSAASPTPAQRVQWFSIR